jgi:putative component of toxin-antitoxin plasmid stabilization module
MGEAVYLLLCGGDKSSQQRDIGQAIAILRRLENGT